MGLLAVSKIIKQESVYKLLQERHSETCLKYVSFYPSLWALFSCFIILDTANNSTDLKLKEALQSICCKQHALCWCVISVLLSSLSMSLPAASV